jgi:hypothetical protein
VQVLLFSYPEAYTIGAGVQANLTVQHSCTITAGSGNVSWA